MLKRILEEIENDQMLFNVEYLPAFLNVLLNYLGILLIFLVCSIVGVPLLIRSVPYSIGKWYNKKNAAKIEAKRLANLKSSVRKALDNHAVECLKQNPNKLAFKEAFVLAVQLNFTDVNSFLRNAFFNYNDMSITIIPNQNLKTCDSQRRRSLGDIFLICNFYYPECTIHDVISTLVHMLENGRLRASYCNTINKYVFHNEYSGGYIRYSKVEYKGIDNFEDIIYTYKNASL